MGDRNFTKFTWRIENFSYIKDGCLQSPTFESHSFQWELIICPADDKGHITLMLRNLDGKPRISLDYSIAFLDSEGLLLLWREKKNIFLGPRSNLSSSSSGFGSSSSSGFEVPVFSGFGSSSSSGFGSSSFSGFRTTSNLFGNTHDTMYLNQNIETNTALIDIKRDDFFSSSKSTFLSDGILIVECHIWLKDYPLSGTDFFFARTRFEPTPLKKKKTFVLNVNDVSFLGSKFILDHVEPMDGNFLTIQLTLNNDEKFFVCVTPSLYRIHANFKIFLLDVKEKRIQFANVEFGFKEKHQKESFDTNITKLMLMTYRNQFLSNETLSLVFECTLLYQVSFSSLLSENEYNARNTQQIVLLWIIPETKPRTVEPKIETTKNSDPPSDVNRALKNILEEGFLSDFSLLVKDKTFPVHKVILGARSSVFRAMFTADMKEKEIGSVDIPDVDADTIQRMLNFVYCDSVQEDLQWESASSLYAAADKYALEPLKQRCSDILKFKLCASSVFGVLMIADTHHDQDLKDSALDYILENDKEIVGTEAWSRFTEEHNQLAFEVIQKLYIKKMDA